MYPTSDTRKNWAAIGSHSSSSRLRIKRGAAAPPLVSLPLFETDAVTRHGDGIELEDNGHNEQGHIESAHVDFWAMGGWTPGDGIRLEDNGRNEQGHIESAHADFWAMGGWTPGDSIRPEDNGDNEQGHIESAHVDFWAMGGWTPEGSYPGSTLERPSIPTQLKGKGKAVIRDPNEDEAMPEERDFSGYGPPQPGSQANLFVHSFTAHTQTDTSYQINHPYLYKNRAREDSLTNAWGVCRSYELHQYGASSSGFCPDFSK